MPIKIYSSIQKNAPALTGVSSSLISVLDAILVNGYGQVNVTSIIRSGVIATVTTDSAHGFSTGDVALIAGANELEYNGEFVVTVTGSTSFTYDVTGSPSTPATGTIISKRAPAGFTKVFESTNKAVYRSNDLSSRRHYYRFVDDGTTSGGAREARLWGYETMLDVDTGTGGFGGFYCQKSMSADSVARHWLVITDGKTVYFFAYIGTPTYSSINYPASDMHAFGFGDALEFKPGDAHLSWVTGNPNSNQFSSTQFSGLFRTVKGIGGSTDWNYPSITAARDFTAVPGPRAMQPLASGLSEHLGSTALISYPHQVDNGFYMTPVLLTQAGPSTIRGRLPGFYEPLPGRCFPNMQIIENVVGFPGRKFMMVWGKNNSYNCAAVVDITGPWDI